MTRRPRPTSQLSLALSVPLQDIVVPDEVVQVLADLLLEAVGAHLDMENREEAHEHQDHR